MALSSLRRFLLLVALLIAAPVAARAQVGSTTDIITGTVTDSLGKPLEGARVTARSVATGIARSRTTNEQGRYTILFPDGGGQYRLTVTAIGYPPRTTDIQRAGDEDRILADVRLGGQLRMAQQIGEVRVTARRGNQGPGANAPTPGESQRGFSTDQASRLPVDQNDLNALAAITPGVVAQAGSDSTQAGFNVAGQRTTGNNLTLDGITFGSAQLPQEAIGGTRVITNTYDVGRGQFTGGQIATTTRGGTNALQWSASGQLRDPSLQWRPNLTGPLGQGSALGQLSAGVGGPIVEDKAFWFVSGLLSQRTSPLNSLTANANDPASLERFGVSIDTVQRFLTTLQGRNIPVTNGAVPGQSLNGNVFLIGRLDWNLTEDHTLTVRPNWSRQQGLGNGIGTFAVPVHGGDSDNRNLGVQTSLTSRFGMFVNEAKAFWTRTDRAQAPYVTFPEGRVRVQSPLDDGSVGVNTLSFGANPRFPQDAQQDGLEATNELSWISSDASHRVKFGALYNWRSYEQEVANSRYGSYSYNTLEDFVLDRPATYTRALNPRRGEGASVNAALYLGDAWRVSREFQLTYGVRVEGSRYDGAPGYNAAVEQAFGLRTDRFPSEVAAFPRVGFSWFKLEDGQAPTWFVRGGAGGFRGLTPSVLHTNAQQFSGLSGADSVLFCVGPAVPVVPWDQLVGGAIPTSCAGGAPPVLRQTQPQVVAFEDGFRSQQSWRASLGVTRRFWQRWAFSVDGLYALGTALYGVTDANLDATTRFTLANEGNRPVFVPVGAIDPTSGVAPVAASRRDPTFGQVLAINSRLQSRTAQLTTSLNAFTNRGIIFNLSYTLQRVTDQSSFDQGSPFVGFASPTTAGNPNVLEFARSTQERRHNLIGTVTMPIGPSWEVTTIVGLQSGAPFTPLVGGDINGDGARNDRAFLFDPDAPSTDPVVAAAMRRVLANAAPSVRDCVKRQLGGIAGRNSCTNPWLPTLNFQVNWKPDALGLARRLAVSFVIQNPLNGLDRMLHGANLRGWGQPQFSDPTLLYVRGFDALNNRYVYEVNERFGNTAQLTRAFFQPFQVGINARFSYGATSLADRFGFGGGGGGPRGGGGGGGGGGGFAAIFGGGGGGGVNPNAARVLSPVGRILELRDTLGLDTAQVRRLQDLQDALGARNDSLGTAIREKIRKLGNNPAPELVFSTVRTDIEKGRTIITDALKQAEAILTPEQWAKVPANVKNPFAGFFGGPPGQGGGGGRPPR